MQKPSSLKNCSDAATANWAKVKKLALFTVVAKYTDCISAEV